MRHYKIIKVVPIVHKGKQLIKFILEGLDNPVWLTYGSVKQNTGIDIKEVEILVNSTLRPEFYKKGEKMFSSKFCFEDNIIIKNFWITLDGTIEELREKNKKEILQLKEINKIEVFKTKKDKELACIITNSINSHEDNDLGDEEETYISTKSLTSITTLQSNNYNILKGSYIYPIYYQEGEDSISGKIRQSNAILKNLNLRFFGTIEEMREEWRKYIEYLKDEQYYKIQYENSDEYKRIVEQFESQDELNKMIDDWLKQSGGLYDF